MMSMKSNNFAKKNQQNLHNKMQGDLFMGRRKSQGDVNLT